MNADRKIWTEEEWATLRRMRDAGESWAAIDQALGRPAKCSRSKWENERAKERTRTDKSARALRPLHAEHQSLIAAFCGDPLPGRSALDRKRAGIADPEHLDRRLVQAPKKPTLYTGERRA